MKDNSVIARRSEATTKQSPTSKGIASGWVSIRPTGYSTTSPRNDGVILLIIISLLLSSCTTKTPQTPPQVVTVYSTSAATPWMEDVYSCAESIAVINRVDDPTSADISLRVGEPEFLVLPTYQIDEEDILIVTHRESPVQNLTLEESQNLFAGFGNPSVQVWVYASDEDVFEVFDQFVMKGRSVSSSARVAVTPQQMSDILNTEANAVGILPRHWKAGGVRDVFSVATVPVLAITRSEPEGAVNQLIGCLQKYIPSISRARVGHLIPLDIRTQR